MILKNIFRITLFLLLIAIAMPASSALISPGSPPASSIPKPEDPRTQQLLYRLEQIKGMDKSELTRLERKSLRKEVKEIRKEMKEIKGGVYLSVGAIIIIILLLILIL